MDKTRDSVLCEHRLVQGGFDDCSLSWEELDVMKLLTMARSTSAGAVSSFLGTTRDTFEGLHVTHLEYEAYPEMALKSMLDICSAARAKWSLISIVLQHKLGPCPVSDISVAIIVSSVHRKDSLEAVQFVIDELKDKVSIWKKECYAEGAAKWKDNSLDSGARGDSRTSNVDGTA